MNTKKISLWLLNAFSMSDSGLITRDRYAQLHVHRRKRPDLPSWRSLTCKGTWVWLIGHVEVDFGPKIQRLILAEPISIRYPTRKALKWVFFQRRGQWEAKYVQYDCFMLRLATWPVCLGTCKITWSKMLQCAGNNWGKELSSSLWLYGIQCSMLLWIAVAESSICAWHLSACLKPLRKPKDTENCLWSSVTKYDAYFVNRRTSWDDPRIDYWKVRTFYKSEV